MARSKQEPDGLTKSSLTRSSARSRDEGEDVEGHAMHRGGESDELTKSSLTKSSLTRSSARSRDEDDVEGHSMLINPGVSRDLAKARDADIQRAVRARNQEAEAKRPFRK